MFASGLNQFNTIVLELYSHDILNCYQSASLYAFLSMFLSMHFIYIHLNVFGVTCPPFDAYLVHRFHQRIVTSAVYYDRQVLLQYD